jgi:ribosome recycling factor
MEAAVIKEVLQDAREHMEKTIEALHSDLRAIRTGRASPALLERVQVDYYGMATPLNQLAGITVPEPRLLVIRPWDRNTIGIIEKAILKSDLGLTPTNDGQVIRLIVPQLTEERRRDLTRLVAKRVEEARVSARNVRRDAIEMLRDLEKEKVIDEDQMYDGREQVQKLTDDFIKQIDEVGKAKDAEIWEG